MGWDSSRAEDGLRWSPYDGRRFSGRVVRTYLGGCLAYDGKSIVNRPGAGRFVARGASKWFQENPAQ